MNTLRRRIRGRCWPNACGGRRKHSAFPGRKARLGKAFPSRTAVSSDHDGAAFDQVAVQNCRGEEEGAWAGLGGFPADDGGANIRAECSSFDCVIAHLVWKDAAGKARRGRTHRFSGLASRRRSRGRPGRRPLASHRSAASSALSPRRKEELDTAVGNTGTGNGSGNPKVATTLAEASSRTRRSSNAPQRPDED